MSAPTLYRENVLDTHVSFGSLVESSKLFETAVAKRVLYKDKVIHFGELPVPGTSTCVPLYPDKGYSTVVVVQPPDDFTDPDMFGHCWSTAYDEACASASVSTVALSAGNSEFSRLRFVKKLVDSGKFCTSKTHWLYGAYNPAEFAVYRSLFSQFVYSKLELAVCSSCFIYSLFGVGLSEDRGVYLPLPNVSTTHTKDLGMLRWVNQDMDRWQYRLFVQNVDLISAFCRGDSARDYVDRACAILSVSEEVLV